MTKSASQPAKVSTRDRLLHSAIDLFAANGFGNTSVKAIAAHAGVSQGLMYRYFESKDALLRAVLEEGLRDVWSTFEARTDGDPLDAIEKLMRSSFATVAEHDSLWRLLYALRNQPAVVERFSPELFAWFGAIERELEKLCERAGMSEPATEAKLLFALIDGANQHRTLDPAEYPVEDLIRAVMSRYRGGA